MDHSSETAGTDVLSARERLILETIWLSGPVSRSDIAELTNLGGAATTRLTRTLEERRLVTETEKVQGARGQPARPLRVVPDGAYAFGVNFSHSYIDMGLVDLGGQLISSERRRLERADCEEIGQLACESLMRQTAACGITLDRVVGAGFAIPGDFGETPAAFQAHALYPHLRGHDLAAEFSALIPLPVVVENDAASAAVGERINGAGKNFGNFLLVHLGQGVGGGIIWDGRLFRGAHGNAGILGLLYPDSEPRPSGQDLLQHLQAAGLAITDFDGLADLRPEDCPPLRRWLLRAADQLRAGLPVASRILDPEAIILGGRLPPHLIATIVELIDGEAMFRSSRHLPWPPLLASTLGPSAGVIGAASLAQFEAFFLSPASSRSADRLTAMLRGGG